MRAKDMGRGGERLMTDICLVETSKWKQSSVALSTSQHTMETSDYIRHSGDNNKQYNYLLSIRCLVLVTGEPRASEGLSVDLFVCSVVVCRSCVLLYVLSTSGSTISMCIQWGKCNVICPIVYISWTHLNRHINHIYGL